MNWVKSTFSNGNGGNNCVEVADLYDEPTGARAVAVRDSKEPGPMLIFTLAEWDAFRDGVKAGEFDRIGYGGDVVVVAVPEVRPGE